MMLSWSMSMMLTRSYSLAQPISWEFSCVSLVHEYEDHKVILTRPRPFSQESSVVALVHEYEADLLLLWFMSMIITWSSPQTLAHFHRCFFIIKITRTCH